MSADVARRNRHDPDFDAAISGAAVLGIVGGDRLRLAKAARADPRALHAAAFEIARDRIGAAFGKLLVVSVAARRIGVAIYVDISLVILREHLRDLKIGRAHV